MIWFVHIDHGCPTFWETEPGGKAVKTTTVFSFYVLVVVTQITFNGSHENWEDDLTTFSFNAIKFCTIVLDIIVVLYTALKANTMSSHSKPYTKVFGKSSKFLLGY